MAETTSSNSIAAQKHPLYIEMLPDWTLMRHVYQGERVVKEQGTVYLPATSSMIRNGQTHSNTVGAAQYTAYLARAVFPDFVPDSVDTAMGMLWANQPVINLPEKLKPLLDRASNQGETLIQLLRRIHEAQLVGGRIGLLADMPEQLPIDVPQLPYIATYDGMSILNWDNGLLGDRIANQLNFVSLDETEQVRDGFQWTQKAKFRVLSFGNPEANSKFGLYTQTIYDEDREGVSITPSIQGQTLQEIPFVFINSKDILPAPDKPPLLSLARLCMTIYRGEADYRQNLFMQGQDTLVVTGAAENDEDSDTQVGANARLDLPMGATAEYIGVKGEGLMEQRLALENDRRLAASRSGQLVDTTSRQRESGEALNIRVGAQTATLTDISVAAAGGLERLLKIIAKWVGANPDEVSIKPNLDFQTMQLTTRSLVEIQTAKNLGLVISSESIHQIMQDRKITLKTFDEEKALFDKEMEEQRRLDEEKMKLEASLRPKPAAGGGGNQSGGQGGSGRGTSGA